jgi:UDP-3-O-[3-hydroxymyristoyl] glucosamine N-acyltransferase
VIEDNVAIGANTVIDCATFMGDSTFIRQGVKLDNLIQVAHNVEIGSNTVIAAQTGISGSTKVGESSVIGGQVGIAGHLTLASNTSIGAQSGVGNSIKESGTKIMGSPSMDFTQYFRAYVVFKNLPDLNHRLSQLEKKVREFQSLPVKE